MKTHLVPIYAAALAALSFASLLFAADSRPKPSLVERGRYVIKIAGCNDCHTAGYPESGGQLPQESWLSGSPLGYRGAWGTTYAGNLRPLLQSMTAEQWVHTARNIKTRPPMPWFALHAMSDADLRALHAFVATLGPAPGFKPRYLPPGQEPAPPFVTFPPPLRAKT